MANTPSIILTLAEYRTRKVQEKKRKMTLFIKQPSLPSPHKRKLHTVRTESK